MNIAIIGTGVYALALASSLSLNKNNKIKMWSESIESISYIEKNRKNYPPLNIKINKNIKFSTNYSDIIKDTDIIFIAVSSKYVSQVMESLSPFLTKKSIIISCSKGIENDTCLFMSEIINKFVSIKQIAVLSGPSFAKDLALNEVLGLTVATLNKQIFNILKSIFNEANVKLEYSRDLLGVELCGSIKNIIAIGTGIMSISKNRESSQATVVTEAIKEIETLLINLGLKKETILTYAGIGDLVLTSLNPSSRNFSYGYLIGSNNKNKALKFLENNTVEGVYTLKSIYELLIKKKAMVPLIEIIYNIVYKEDNPSSLKTFLLNKN